MARTLPQALVGQSTSGTVHTRTFGASLTPGSCLEVYIIFYHATATISTVSDGTQSFSPFTGLGTTLPFRGDSGLNTPTNHVYRFPNNALSSAPTVTITFSESVVATIWIAEVAGTETTDPDDRAIGAIFSGAAIGPGNLTTAEDTEGIVVLATTNTNVATVGSGYTIFSGLAAFYYDWLQYDLDVGTAGSKATAFGGTSSGSATAFAFKQAGGGGGGPTGQPAVRRLGGIPGCSRILGHEGVSAWALPFALFTTIGLRTLARKGVRK